MNKTYKIFGSALMLLGLTLGSCSPESFEGADPNGLPDAAAYEEFVHVTVNQETNYAVFSFDEQPGVTPVWIINGTKYSTSAVDSQFYRKAGDYTVALQIRNRNGMSDGQITRTFHIDKTKINGFGGFKEDSEFNMWRKANIEEPTFFYAPGWAQAADPTCVKTGYDYSLTLPSATSERWQAQMFIGTDMSTSADKTYDFSVILTSSTDHPAVMVKLVDASDDNVFYFAEEVELKAGEPKCFWKSDMAGLDISKLKLVFDFGGNAANTSINIESLVLKDHANDDGTVLPEVDTDDTVYDYDAETNLWKPVDDNGAFTTEFIYMPS